MYVLYSHICDIEYQSKNYHDKNGAAVGSSVEIKLLFRLKKEKNVVCCSTEINVATCSCCCLGANSGDTSKDLHI